MAGTAATDNSGINADTIASSDANLRLVAKAVKGVIDALIARGILSA